MHFALLAKLAERLGLEELSMGMSGDFARAIAFGATYVRDRHRHLRRRGAVSWQAGGRASTLRHEPNVRLWNPSAASRVCRSRIDSAMQPAVGA